MDASNEQLRKRDNLIEDDVIVEEAKTSLHSLSIDALG